MAVPRLVDGVVLEKHGWRYEGQVLAGTWWGATETQHGRGTWTWKGTLSGHKYVGEWRNDKQSGQGVYTWPDGSRYEGEWKDGMRRGQGVCTWDGRRYEGEWKDGNRSGRGVQWLPDGRVFDGAWAGGFPLQGTAMEPDGALSRAAFDGMTYIHRWEQAERIPAGRVVSGGPPPPGGKGGPPPEWLGRVELADGTAVEGAFRGLRPHGPATVTERGGAAYAAEYDGERTIAEGPVPVRKQVRRPGGNRRIRRQPPPDKVPSQPPDAVAVAAGRSGFFWGCVMRLQAMDGV